MKIDNLDIKKSALVVIDLQNAFCHPQGTLGKSGLDTDRLGSVVQPLREIIERCHEINMPVLWTVQEHLQGDKRRGRKKLPSHTSKRKGVSALAGTWDAAIVDELQDLVTNPTFVIRKHRFGGFYETRMEVVLQQLGVDHLFITGLTTNACVETTIREAYLRDFDVVAIEDGISGVNEVWEEAAKKVWRQYLAVTCSKDEFMTWTEQQLQPKPIGIHHLLLMVEDLERSKDFYLNTLGFTQRLNAKPLPDGREFIATLEGLGLTAGGPGDRKQMDHLAFQVRNVEALYHKLKDKDITFTRGGLGPGPYGKAIYILDPDGNELELFEMES